MSSHAAKDPAVLCESQKLVAAGKYAACRLKAEAKAVKKGLEPDATHCDTKLAKKYAKIERKYAEACVVTGDVATVRLDVGALATDLTAASEGRLVCSDDRSRVTLDSPNARPNPATFEQLDGAIKVNDSVYMAPGFGNTFLVVTPEGNVVIDTSLATFSQGHYDALRAIDSGPVRYIILTHAHADHTGGIELWREEGTDVIAQQNHVEFVNWQHRLAPMLNVRNLSQFRVLFGVAPPPYAPPDAPVDNYGAEIAPTHLFERFCEFRLGGLTFQIVHTPGETYDHLTVWIAEYKIAFSGDNYYGVFPNMYTLRGTRPRWALDYVESLDRILSWNPEILAPGHTSPTYGVERIREDVTRYRDAILFVHDATVQGMNAGKDPFTLMNEIDLPDVGEIYGSVAWTVRGIYEGYVGWYDTNPASLYPAPASLIYPELATLAGGADPLVVRANEMIDAGFPEGALRMTEAALSVDPNNVPALETRRTALERLRAASRNINELGWLTTAIEDVQAQLDAVGP